jgi:hypothetical protein
MVQRPCARNAPVPDDFAQHGTETHPCPTERRSMVQVERQKGGVWDKVRGKKGPKKGELVRLARYAKKKI